MSSVGSMSSDRIRELRAKAQSLEPIVRVGKNGLTPTVINQVNLAIKKHGLVKVKLLRSFTEGNDRKKAAQELAHNTGSQLIQCVGLVAVLYKPSAGKSERPADMTKNTGRKKVSQVRR